MATRETAGTSESDLQELAARVIEAAVSKGVRIAAAESLTGGMVAAALVSVPGASRVFSGGIVAYDTALKASLLRVDAELLRRRGPVDGGVVLQMAHGAREACAVPSAAEGEPEPADLGLATTGVAGPDPDPQTGLPAGTVWVAACMGDDNRAVRLTGLAGANRSEIRSRAVAATLEMALAVLTQ